MTFGSQYLPLLYTSHVSYVFILLVAAMLFGAEATLLFPLFLPLVFQSATGFIYILLS